MKSHFSIWILIFSLSGRIAFSQTKTHIDFIYLKDKGEPYLDVFVQSDSLMKDTKMELACIQISSDGATTERKVFARSFSVYLRKGMNKVQVYLKDKNKENFDQSFFEVIRKFETIPAGAYELKLILSNSSTRSEYTFIRSVDTLVKVKSPVANQIKAKFQKAKRKNEEFSTKDEIQNSKLDILLSQKGLTRHTITEGEHTFMYIYANNWLLGKYKLENIFPVVKAKRIKQAINQKKETLTQTSIENYESIFSQTKKDKNKEEQFAIGQIGVSANMGNQQDAFSEQQKNFYEIQGNVELPLFDIPVSIEGYYTTQDIKRRVKSSYVRFHYDVDKAKEKLMKLITGYKGQYEQVSQKGQGLDGNYKQFLHTLSGQKESIFYQLIAQTGLKEYTSFVDQESLQRGEYKIDTTQLLDALMKKSDSLTVGNKDALAIQKSRDSIRVVYGKIMKKYNDLKALEQKYEKYNTLLSQYKNTAYFDSLIAYNKVKDLKDYESMSYKDLAKTASSMLPDGKIKKATTGITNLDLGMFSKYSSKYTLGGQQIKGIDFGYDIGFATTQITTGKTEYIGRTGEIDRYSFYSGSLKFKPVLKQQFDLIYYGYTPSRRMFNDDKEFFKNVNTSMPSFRNPVHIISVKQQGSISKYIHTETEIALSDKKTEQEKGSKPGLYDRMAYSITLEGDIPKTSVSIVSSFEHTGRDFENSTLPFSFIGTDRLKVGTKTSLFNNYLHIGIEYNYLLQKNLANTFTNSRWGFDIKTQSKRYPNIALSYKPFSTYRSFADTLGIPQRPLFGEVWTGKASYQLRKDKNIYRFMLLFNHSGNKMDTTQTKNELFQFSFYMMNKTNMTSLSVTKMNFVATSQETIASWHAQNSYMISIAQGYAIQKNINTSAGIDLGLSKFGLSSIGGNAGISLRSPKPQLTYRLNARYTQYRLEENNSWLKVLRGTLDITWQFKYKLNDLEKTY